MKAEKRREEEHRRRLYFILPPSPFILGFLLLEPGRRVHRLRLRRGAPQPHPLAPADLDHLDPRGLHGIKRMKAEG